MSATKRRAVDMLMSADNDHTAGYVPSAAATVALIPEVSTMEAVSMSGQDEQQHTRQTVAAVAAVAAGEQQMHEEETVPQKQPHPSHICCTATAVC